MWIKINDDGNFCKLNIFEEILDQDRGGENYTYLMLMKLSMSLKAKYLLVTIEMIFWWGGDGKRDKACQVY